MGISGEGELVQERGLLSMIKGKADSGRNKCLTEETFPNNTRVPWHTLFLRPAFSEQERLPRNL